MRNSLPILALMLWATISASLSRGAETVINDREVFRVGLGPQGKLALVKRSSPAGPYSIVNERGQRLVLEWENPILDAGFLPDGRCAYLVQDRFWSKLLVKAQDGQVLWDFGTDPAYRFSSLSFAEDGQFYSAVLDQQMGWHRIVDRTGWSIHTTFQEPIVAFSITTPTRLHLVVRDSFAGGQELQDRNGRVLHRFDRDEEVLSIRVRDGQATYVVRDRFFDRLVVRTAQVPPAGVSARDGSRETLFDRLHGSAEPAVPARTPSSALRR